MLCPSRERRENEWTGDGAFRGIGAVDVLEAGSKPRGGVEGKGDDVAGIGALRGISLWFGVRGWAWRLVLWDARCCVTAWIDSSFRAILS